MDVSWIKGITKNFAELVHQLKNVDDVAEYLHSDPDPPLITADELEQISKLKTSPKKVRKMLDLIVARGPKSLPALYIALEKTANSHLAELLENYVKQEEQRQTDINKRTNPEWPPQQEELERMNADPVTLCNVDSPSLLMPYKNTLKNYPMRHKVRGLAVIINNMFVGQNGDYRAGSEKDCERMEKVLKQLHFEVKVYKEKTAQEMKDIANQEGTNQIHQKADCFMFVLMSHGKQDGILGVDNKVVPYSELAEPFYSTKCPELEGKPKVFIIQACRGSSMETTVSETSKSDKTKGDDTDSDYILDQMEGDARKNNPAGLIQHTSSNVFSQADFLYAYATAEGYKAYRSTLRGSWFLQAVIWLLKYQSHQENLLEILTQVNRLVSKGRADQTVGNMAALTVSNFRSNLTKNLYFFPGVYDDPPKRHPAE